MNHVTPDSNPTPVKLGLAGHLAKSFLRSKLTPLIVLASLLLGLLAVSLTPREEEPQIVVPMVDVYVPYPGASPREVESQVTTPLEKRLWGIPGVEYLYSTSIAGHGAAHGALQGQRAPGAEPGEVHQELLSNADLLPRGRHEARGAPPYHRRRALPGPDPPRREPDPGPAPGPGRCAGPGAEHRAEHRPGEGGGRSPAHDPHRARRRAAAQLRPVLQRAAAGPPDGRCPAPCRGAGGPQPADHPGRHRLHAGLPGAEPPGGGREGRTSHLPGRRGPPRRRSRA